MTMRKLLSSIKSSTRGLGSDTIVLDDLLKIWIEVIKCQNDNATEKLSILVALKSCIVLWKFEIVFLRNWQQLQGEGSCSSSYPRGNQVDGLPRAAILVQ